MPILSILFGLLLTAVGGAGYGLAETRAVTALIPALVGGALVLLGAIGLTGAAARKHAMHFAAMVSLLGLLAAGGRLGMALAKGAGSDLSRICLALMAVLCGGFLALCVRSFIAARRARTTSAVD